MLLSATLLLPTPVGHHYYTTCYVLAFALNLALLLWEGHRRGYPLRTWLLLLAAVTLAFILGTKLIAMPPADWTNLLRHGQWPVSAARSVLGGAVAGTLTLLALRRRLGFSWHVFDAFALPFCAALAVQCVGCVLTGCCFGELTDGWGLTYAPGSLPYLVQQYRGLLPEGAAHSLAVHPTQLYSLLLCVVVATVLWYTRHRTWPGGSWRLLHLGLLLSGRFLIEFWRDPAGEQVGAALREHGGLVLKQVQWALLLLAPLALGAWALLVRRAQQHPLQPERRPVDQPVRNLLGVAGLLAAAALLGPAALTRPELVVVKGVLLAVVVLETGALLHAATRTRRMAVPLALLSLVLLFTNQAPPDSTRKELEISLGAGNGAFYEDVSTGGGGGCSGPLTRQTFDHRYTVRGANLEFRRSRPENRLTAYGLGIWQGEDRVTYQDLDPTTGMVRFQTDSSQRLFGVNPYFEAHSRLRPGRFAFGFRAGLHLGTLMHYGERNGTNDGAASGNVDLGAWLGVRETLFGQIDVNRGVLGLGNYTGRFALGSGLGRMAASSVLAGVAFSRNSPGFGMGFLSADLRLGNTGFMLYPYGATNFGRHHQLNLRVGYRIPLGRR